MADDMINPSTNFEDPVPIRSWVISCDISHIIPLTMRLQPLRMRRIAWPMRRGNYLSHVFEIHDPLSLLTVLYYKTKLESVSLNCFSIFCQNFRPLPSWIFKISTFSRSAQSRGSICVIVPNFVAISQTIAEIWPYFRFSKWRPPPSAIFEISKF